MPDLSRRSFFRSMVAAGMVATIDPEELLWTPGKKKIFVLPPAQIPTVGAMVIRIMFDGPGWVQAEAGMVPVLHARQVDAAIRGLRSLPGPVPATSTWEDWSDT